MNTAIVKELASTIASEKNGADNQAVIHFSDFVFLAIRPQIASEVISALQFRSDQVTAMVADLSGQSLRSLGQRIHTRGAR